MKLPSFPIDLNPLKDRNNNTFYMGSIKAPMLLTFEKGVALFVFVSEDGHEALNIDCAKEGGWLQSVQKKMKDGEVDQLRVFLEKKKDAYGNYYYMTVVQDDTLCLDLREGYSFFIFTAIEGDEQIQIRRYYDGKEEDRSIPETMRHEPEVLFYRGHESGSHVKVNGGSPEGVGLIHNTSDVSGSSRRTRAVG